MFLSPKLTPMPVDVPTLCLRLPELPSKAFRRSIWDDRQLSPKIRDACAIARKNGYRYIWIDSCCIDKSSSSELSEVINSMYQWYSLADICYAYLADVPPGDDHHAEDSRFRESRWFRRGWTLQELIAPVWVEFLSQDWAPIGSKQALVTLVEGVTSISYEALLKLKPLDAFSVAQRLSWATKRQTTREEDRAYSLLGIFDINMPTIYGEGDRAFRRLQEQIMQRIPDQSLFAWGDVYLPGSKFPSNPIPAHEPITLSAQTGFQSPTSPSARSPDDFVDSGCIRHVQFPTSHHHEIVYTLTSYGIRTQFQMIPLTDNLLSTILPHNEVNLELPGDSQWYLAILGCEHKEQPGYLLGRVCHIPPSASGVDFLYSGYVDFDSRKPGVPVPDLFPLSPETIESSRPHTKLKTVYISHSRPNHTNSYPPWSIRSQPYTVIKLVLLKETCDALHSQGYTADIRDPNPNHPATHWLTLSKDEHTIIVKFQHTLEGGGKRFTIDAEINMSGSRLQLTCNPGLDQMNRHTVSWTDGNWEGWDTVLKTETVTLGAGDAGTVTLDLGLRLAGAGVYVVGVDILCDASPVFPSVNSALLAPSAVGQAGKIAREPEVESYRGHSPSGAIDIDSDRRQWDGECRDFGPGDHGLERQSWGWW